MHLSIPIYIKRGVFEDSQPIIMNNFHQVYWLIVLLNVFEYVSVYVSGSVHVCVVYVRAFQN